MVIPILTCFFLVLKIRSDPMNLILISGLPDLLRTIVPHNAHAAKNRRIASAYSMRNYEVR